MTDETFILKDLLPDEQKGVFAPPRHYIELYHLIDETYAADETWQQTVTLAQHEEQSDVQGKGFYDQVPLAELVSFGSRLREVTTDEEKYRLLAERNSAGILWYDIVLGHVNDKNLPPLVAVISQGAPWGNMIDLGTGPGNALAAVAPYAANVAALDKFDFLLGHAKEKTATRKNVKYTVGDATALPTLFKPGRFDIAVSNGLTHYFSKEQTVSFIRGLNRIMKRGGVFLEPWINVEPGDILPKVEQEYLGSAKGLLVCLMDRICSKVDANYGMDIQTLVDTYQSNGFSVTRHPTNPDNVYIVQYQRVF